MDSTAKIEALKGEERHQEIQAMIAAYKDENPIVPEDLAYLEGELFNEYIADMKLAQQFAHANRQTIARIIAEHMRWDYGMQFDSVLLCFL